MPKYNTVISFFNCLNCSASTEITTGKRLRKYCTRKCRDQAYYRRKKAIRSKGYDS